MLKITLGADTCQRWLGRQYGGPFLMHHFEAISLGTAKVIDEINLNNDKQVQRIKRALDSVKKDEEFKQMMTGGGKNRPEPYRRKIEFVAEKVRSAL
jgi:hypothetical protein